MATKKKQTAKPKIIRLKDYTPPDFLIDTVSLYFDLHEEKTIVKAVMGIRRNPGVKANKRPLVLDGEDMTLKVLLLNGQSVPTKNYSIDKEHLTIEKLPNLFVLETEVEINPKANTRLEGLYYFSGNFCTQCEAHGFRRITYFMDRPDVMTKFTTAISADKKKYPVLLSNGNLIEEKDLGNGRHWVKWEDPSLKPCYLFALVGGDLEWLEDTYHTLSGRPVTLRVFVEKGKRDQAQFAMDSLKRAMSWDEQTYEREYDLDIYMIVAVSYFNMGAMENKGLNIFNDKYILAKETTATDADFIDIESVIGHEYFHNWSGNRVTVSNWFQITLKEGLTRFRDQSFTGDLHSPVVECIEEANVIRTAQFAQDAGPLAHPIQPDEYMQVNNFYTVTVYEKGAEVIRMIRTILGKENFRKAMILYYERNDGKAVTTEEFVKAMEDASGVNLKQFRLWYSQAGTPVLDIKTKYDAKKKTYTFTIKQSCPKTPGQSKKKDLHIPLALGLLDPRSGKDLLIPATQVLNIKKKTEIIVFKNITTKPIPSLLRNFSAPVKLKYDYTDEELLFLLTHDSDGFNRWDAGQTLACKIIFQLVKDYRKKKKLVLDPAFIKAIETLLVDEKLDLQLLTEMLTLPRMAYLMELMPVVDIEGLWVAREFVKTELVKHLHKNFLNRYQRYHNGIAYQFNAKAIGERSLKNLCLAYLMQLDQADMRALSLQQFRLADNMTDHMGSLGALINSKGKERSIALAEFYKKWKKEDLVVQKWFALQAMSALPDTLATVKKLLKHPAYDYKNPNKVRALVGTFTQANYINFHNKNGSGYKFLGEQVLKADKINPQLAARLVEPLTRWRKFDKPRQKLMRTQLSRIVKTPKLSKDVYELASKSL